MILMVNNRSAHHGKLCSLVQFISLIEVHTKDMKFSMWLFMLKILSSRLCQYGGKSSSLSFLWVQACQKALFADSSYKPASENLAMALTDLGTNLKLSGNVQQGLQKYCDALKADSTYAVSNCLSIQQIWWIAQFVS